MQSFAYSPIGVLHTPFAEPTDMPIQPTGAAGVHGTAELRPELADGLRDLDGFSHVILLYHFHRSTGFDLGVTPFMDTVSRGLFATRAPRRPNPIGLSIVRLDRVENNTLHLLDVDMLDGSPLLDIKPYVATFDAPPADRFGWLQKAAAKAQTLRSDSRFSDHTD